MSSLLLNYVSEFVAVSEHLLKSEKGKLYKGCILAAKEEVEILLNKNQYDTAGNKFKIWKALKWIDAEERRVTKRVYVKEQKKYQPFVKIDENVYETLKKLISDR